MIEAMLEPYMVHATNSTKLDVALSFTLEALLYSGGSLLVGYVCHICVYIYIYAIPTTLLCVSVKIITMKF